MSNWVLIIFLTTNTPRPVLDHVYFVNEAACEAVAKELRALPHKFVKCYPTDKKGVP